MWVSPALESLGMSVHNFGGLLGILTTVRLSLLTAGDSPAANPHATASSVKSDTRRPSAQQFSEPARYPPPTTESQFAYSSPSFSTAPPTTSRPRQRLSHAVLSPSASHSFAPPYLPTNPLRHFHS